MEHGVPVFLHVKQIQVKFLPFFLDIQDNYNYQAVKASPGGLLHMIEPLAVAANLV